MAIQNKHEETEIDGKKQNALILTITNGHKDTIEKLVKAYDIKEGDEAKLIAYLIAVASNEKIIGKPIGSDGRYFSPPDDWVNA